MDRVCSQKNGPSHFVSHPYFYSSLLETTFICLKSSKYRYLNWLNSLPQFKNHIEICFTILRRPLRGIIGCVMECKIWPLKGNLHIKAAHYRTYPREGLLKPINKNIKQNNSVFATQGNATKQIQFITKNALSCRSCSRIAARCLGLPAGQLICILKKAHFYWQVQCFQYFCKMTNGTLLTFRFTKGKRKTQPLSWNRRDAGTHFSVFFFSLGLSNKHQNSKPSKQTLPLKPNILKKLNLTLHTNTLKRLESKT